MIHFTKVRWKNLLSYGNTFTEILLDRSPSTLVTGPNGGGKSTVLEAICFCLFGKPFRKINKPQLVNTKNGRGLITEIEFGNGKDEYLVRRGVKPELFEVFKNGTLQNQPGAKKDYQAILEGQILKFDHSVFTQIVLVGKATHVSFMKLDSQRRRNFVESMLNLLVFGVMNKLQTAKSNELKEKIMEMRGKITVCQDRITMREGHILDLEAEMNENVAVELARVQSERDALAADIEKYKNTLFSVMQQVVKGAADNVEAAHQRRTKLAHMRTKCDVRLEDLQKQLDQLQHQATCSSCGQDITPASRAVRMMGVTCAFEEMNTAKTDLGTKIQEADAAIVEEQNLYEISAAAERDCKAVAALLKDKKASLAKLDAIPEKKVNTAKIEAEQSILETVRADLAALIEQRGALGKEQEYWNLIGTMLKDSGVKSSIIKNFIPIINHHINTNLARLGFFAKFTLDENFEETIQARGIDTMSYNNFSEGEKLRIDMAILLAWRELAKLQNNMSTNLLFFDEIFDASLDTYGTEALATLMSELKSTNIFIITHTPEKIADKVRSQIVFEVVDGFSRMTN